MFLGQHESDVAVRKSPEEDGDKEASLVVAVGFSDYRLHVVEVRRVTNNTTGSACRQKQYTKWYALRELLVPVNPGCPPVPDV